MNSKKGLITTIIVVVVAVAGISLWDGGFSWLGGGTKSDATLPSGEVAPQSGIEEQAGGQTGGEMGVATVAGSVGKMTEDIYVDIAAQTAYSVQKDPAGALQIVKDLFSKYGVTQENMDAYADVVSKDIQMAQKIAQKYTLRLQELMKTGK